MADKPRCHWANVSSAMQDYHDHEWGRPTHDDQALFERLCLEIYQAGLSWALVLNKRAAFRQAFHDFQIQAVAAMSEVDIDALMQDDAIIRNRRKLDATVNNAQAVLKIVTEFGSFAKYFWDFVGEPEVHSGDAIPTETAKSVALAKDLKQRGFKFVGAVTIYGLMQSVGAVNDHERDCAWR